MDEFDRLIASKLELLRQSGLYRTLKTCEPLGGMRVRVDDGQTQTAAVNFCGNDYLGLAASNDPAGVAEAARAAGAGAGASRLVSGTHPAHVACEGEIAALLGKEAALLFASGFQANLGLVTALAEICGDVLSDSDNHASLIDACRLARTNVRVVPHCDVAALEEALAKCRGPALVVIESLYSMNGDAWDFAALRELKQRRPFVLLVDEAHGFGAYGPQGKGVLARAGALALADIYMAGLGKAVGLAGAFVAASKPVIALLINRARSFIYTTALSPLLATLLSARLKIIRDQEPLREALQANVKLFRSALAAQGLAHPGEPYSAIVPVILGEPEQALAAAHELLLQGYFVSAIRPPTVPADTARLRVSLSALHTAEDVAGLAAAIGALTR
jgi:8-amino-7-oxononanoate synthase